jgi:hypothetical protein
VNSVTALFHELNDVIENGGDCNAQSFEGREQGFSRDILAVRYDAEYSGNELLAEGLRNPQGLSWLHGQRIMNKRYAIMLKS